MIVSRSVDKIKYLVKDLERAYPGIKTCYYSMDFLYADAEQYEGLATLIQHLDVAVLVNNVGLSH